MPSSQKAPPRHASSQSAASRSTLEPHVLDVHMVDAVAPVARGPDRVAAGGGQVAGVEQEPDARALEQPLDLGRRLHARAHVVVEGRLEAAGTRQLDGALDPVEVDVAVPRALVAEHRLRVGALEQVERRLERREVPVAEPELDEGARELQPAARSRARSSSPRPR